MIYYKRLNVKQQKPAQVKGARGESSTCCKITPVSSTSVSYRAKLCELKYGTSCQLLSVRHTDAPEALDDARSCLVALISSICSLLLNLKKKMLFCSVIVRLKKKEGEKKRGLLRGCIQLRISLWLHFPSNVMLDRLCLS